MDSYIRNVNAVNMSYAVSNPDIVVKYLKSMIEAGRWLTDNKNREGAINILIKYEQMTQKIGQRVYDFLVNKIAAFPKNGEISPDGIKLAMVDLARSGLMSTPTQEYKKFIDLKYLELSHKELGVEN